MGLNLRLSLSSTPNLKRNIMPSVAYRVWGKSGFKVHPHAHDKIYKQGLIQWPISGVIHFYSQLGLPDNVLAILN